MGTELVHQLDGIFSFVLLDVNNDRVIAARDPIGVTYANFCLLNQIYAIPSRKHSSLINLQIRFFFTYSIGHFITDGVQICQVLFILHPNLNH